MDPFCLNVAVASSRLAHVRFPYATWLIALAAIGCSSHPAPLPTFHTKSDSDLDHRDLVVDGTTWHYTIYIPKSDKPLPVVIGLHGRGGNGDGFIADSQLLPMARKEKFILIAPSSQGDRWRDIDKDPLQARDLAFFSALIDTIPQLGGDPKRVYLTGFSNGGGMTFFLGGYFSDRIAAIAPGGASIGALDEQLVYHEAPAPKRPVPALIFHGMTDEISGYDMRTFSVALPDAAQWWAQQIGAGDKPKHEERANGAVKVDTYGDPGKPQCILLSYRDMGHSWPSYKDHEYKTDFDEEMWAFLSKYKLN